MYRKSQYLPLVYRMVEKQPDVASPLDNQNICLFLWSIKTVLTIIYVYCHTVNRMCVQGNTCIQHVVSLVTIELSRSIFPPRYCI